MPDTAKRKPNPPNLFVRFPGPRGPVERAEVVKRAEAEGLPAAEWARMVLLERARSRLPVAPSAPAAAGPDPIDCPHPKGKRSQLGYVTICRACGATVR